MKSAISDLINFLSDLSIQKDKREVVRTVRTNPRSDRLAIEMPLATKEDVTTLWEVFPWILWILIQYWVYHGVSNPKRYSRCTYFEFFQ